MRAYDLPAIMTRLESLAAIRDAETTDRQAAVAVVLRAPRLGFGAKDAERRSEAPSVEGAAEAEILLIRRSEREGDPWSGHMAFPGGRRDPSDPSLYHTACRETLEEVGLDLAAHARFIGRLPDIPAVARARRVGMLIAPFVFALDDEEPPPFVLSDEVAEVLWAPLGPMARGEVSATYSYQHEGNVYELPAFDVEARIVWGLTYRMLEMLFEVLHRQ